MKRFALLRLERGGNKAIFECYAETVAQAADIFNEHMTNAPKLDKEGYAKQGDVSYCVAEFWEPFHTLN